MRIAILGLFAANLLLSPSPAQAADRTFAPISALAELLSFRKLPRKEGPVTILTERRDYRMRHEPGHYYGGPCDPLKYRCVWVPARDRRIEGYTQTVRIDDRKAFIAAHGDAAFGNHKWPLLFFPVFGWEMLKGLYISRLKAEDLARKTPDVYQRFVPLKGAR